MSAHEVIALGEVLEAATGIRRASFKHRPPPTASRPGSQLASRQGSFVAVAKPSHPPQTSTGPRKVAMDIEEGGGGGGGDGDDPEAADDGKDGDDDDDDNGVVPFSTSFARVGGGHAS